MKKKKGYVILYIITILFTLSAVSTLIPQATVSKACLLGYKAHCPFTPIGTILCLGMAGFLCVVRKKRFTEHG